LPDRPTDGLDLREYYARTRRYFWTLLTLFQALYVADGIYFSRGDSEHIPHWALVLVNVLMCLPLTVSIVLLFSKSRSVHYVGLSLLFAVMLLHYGAFSIK
jgi:hypothetical protein